MQHKKIGVAILAAGEGKRLKIPQAKPLLPLLGKKMIDFPIKAVLQFCQQTQFELTLGLVIGHLKLKVQDYIEETYFDHLTSLKFAIQKQPLGTADALKSYFAEIPEAHKTDYTLVMCADTPLITSKDLDKLFVEFSEDSSILGVAATFNVSDPQGYGRIIRSNPGFRIIEEKHLTSEFQKINEVNSSLYFLKTSFLLEALNKINFNQETQEFYLTDLFQEHLQVRPILFEQTEHFLGVNNLEQLETASKILQKEKITYFQHQGVLFQDSSQVLIDWDVEIGAQSVIYPNVTLEGKTSIGTNVTIEPGVIIRNSKIHDHAFIKAYSYIENSIIGPQAEIGPFARIRPDTHVGQKAKIGNFVEIKKSQLDAGVKISHLSYVGDAIIGEETNIGCGFITCNYDGLNKHQTIIGKKTFIGSDCQMVAPISIGESCFIAAGSTITQSIPSESFAIARSKQITKAGMSKKFLKSKDSIDTNS